MWLSTPDGGGRQFVYVAIVDITNAHNVRAYQILHLRPVVVAIFESGTTRLKRELIKFKEGTR